jgi:hypothetical protein
MQHCEDCGTELPIDALFCGKCGWKTASKTEETENLSDALKVDVPISPPAISKTSDELQNSASENGEEEEQQTQDVASENDGEDEEQQTQDVASENDGEEEEQQTQHVASENDGEEEQQSQRDHFETTSSIPGDPDPGREMPANKFLDEQPQYEQTPSGTQESLSPYNSTRRSGARPVSKCLLLFLAGLIVVAGVIAALVGLFHVNLPGTGGSSTKLSNSSINYIIKSTGSSLTASICVKSSTPTTSGTNGGTGFTLFASSGCSTVIAAPANALCLIFPENTGASHKYIFDVSDAAIDSEPYHLVLGVAEYTGSATYNDAKHISVGISEGSTGQNFSWLYLSGNVTINKDEQSGTMDVILESVSGGNTIHVVGDWACGRQIKNT